MLLWTIMGTFICSGGIYLGHATGQWVTLIHWDRGVYFSPLQWLHGLHRNCEGLSSHTGVDISLQATHCGLETLHIAKQMRLTYPERMLQDCKKRRQLHGPSGRAQPQSPAPIIGAQYKHLATLHYVEPRILENCQAILTLFNLSQFSKNLKS